MKATVFKVGMLVEHPNRPEWGVGKVSGVEEDRLHIFFKGNLEKKAKVILRSIISLTVAEDQTDPVLDSLPEASQEDGGWVLPKNYEKKMAAAAKLAAVG